MPVLPSLTPSLRPSFAFSAAISAAFAMALAGAPVSALASPDSSVSATPASQACDESKNRESALVKDQYCNRDRNQFSILANITRDTLEGTQAALAGNIAAEKVKTQISGGFNYAREVRTQLGWNVNIAHQVEALQLGGWNIADTVKGMQIGFVNISKQIDGSSIGMFTFSKNGLMHLNLSSEETGMGHITFASGHKFYTAFDFGYTIEDANHPFSVGLGFGRHWAFGDGYVEFELFMHMVADKRTTESQWERHEKHGHWDDAGINHLGQAKLRLGQSLFGKGGASPAGHWGGLGVYAGLSFNALLHGDNEALIHPWTDHFSQEWKHGRYWPGLEVGIRLGR